MLRSNSCKATGDRVMPIWSNLESLYREIVTPWTFQVPYVDTQASPHLYTLRHQCVVNLVLYTLIPSFSSSQSAIFIIHNHIYSSSFSGFRNFIARELQIFMKKFTVELTKSLASHSILPKQQHFYIYNVKIMHLEVKAKS